VGELVRAGYDALGPRFGEWAARIRDPTRGRLTAELASRLPEGARVLDLGCGAGALARLLAERFEVVGVDISQEQLALARKDVPEATFVEADFGTLELEEASFDAVCALYSITHLARREHAALFARIAGWLRPGGLCLASLALAVHAEPLEQGLLERASVALLRNEASRDAPVAPPDSFQQGDGGRLVGAQQPPVTREVLPAVARVNRGKLPAVVTNDVQQRGDVARELHLGLWPRKLAQLVIPLETRTFDPADADGRTFRDPRSRSPAVPAAGSKNEHDRGGDEVAHPLISRHGSPRALARN
jgi:SAM-dependent methyltransferase